MIDDNPEPNMQNLTQRLRRARGEAEKSTFRGGGRITPQGSAAGLAFRIGVELVSALAVAVGIGWLLDVWLGTRPWLLLVFILLGMAAGILNVYRVTRGYGYQAGYHPGGNNGDDAPASGHRGSKDNGGGPRS
jgi:ATP synthase protein I